MNPTAKLDDAHLSVTTEEAASTTCDPFGSARAGRAAPVAAPVIVSDQTSLAIVGMTDRQFRAFVAEHKIPHRNWRRHIFVRVDHIMAALGLADVEPAATRPAWDEAAVIELAARPRRSR